MPVYEYECQACGPFEALRPMSAFEEPCTCPSCCAAAPRVLRTAPGLALMNGARRSAHATNERSADSPRKQSHAPGCACCSGGRKVGSKTLHRPDGSKSFPSKRPWMISH